MSILSDYKISNFRFNKRTIIYAGRLYLFCVFVSLHILQRKTYT